MGDQTKPPVIAAAVVAAAIVAGVLAWIVSGTSPRDGEEADEHAAHSHPSLLGLFDVNDPTQVLNVTGTSAPTLAVATARAPDGGWDIRLDTTNFRFAPEGAAGPVIPGEGHAHLYVDANYLGEFGVANYHVARLSEGTHEIAVGLYALDHRAYANNGSLVQRRIVVRQTASQKAAKLPAGPPKVFALAMAGGRVAGQANDTIRVKQGDQVQFYWTSDQAVLLHLEGYDIEFQVAPRSPVALLLDADLVGRFPINTHDANGREAGTVLYLEVYP